MTGKYDLGRVEGMVWTRRVRSSLLANSIDPDTIPPDDIPGVMAILATREGTIPQCEVVGASMAAAEARRGEEAGRPSRRRGKTYGAPAS